MCDLVYMCIYGHRGETLSKLSGNYCTNKTESYKIPHNQC